MSAKNVILAGLAFGAAMVVTSKACDEQEAGHRDPNIPVLTSSTSAVTATRTSVRSATATVGVEVKRENPDSDAIMARVKQDVEKERAEGRKRMETTLKNHANRLNKLANILKRNGYTAVNISQSGKSAEILPNGINLEVTHEGEIEVITQELFPGTPPFDALIIKLDKDDALDLILGSNDRLIIGGIADKDFAKYLRIIEQALPQYKKLANNALIDGNEFDSHGTLTKMLEERLGKLNIYDEQKSAW